MFKKRMWLGVILSIILLVFSINGFTLYYKYTQESGTNFYVGTADKSDALEDTNEVRQILDDLGNLLGHSKRDDLYPKNGDTGGYLGRLNYGVDASKPAVPVVNDMYLATDTVKVYRCFVAGNWVEIYPSSISDNVIKTGDFTAGRIAKINNASGIIEQGTNTDTDVADAVTKKHTQNTDTALGIQTQDLDMGTHKITNVVNPEAYQDVSTKAYADSHCDLSKDQSPQLANDLDLNDQNIKIDADLDTDHNYSGLVDVELVGESVVFGSLLYFNWTDKEWKCTDADTSTTMPGLRIALETKTDGQTCLMLVKGYIRDDSFFEFAGAMVYASATPGGVTSTAPSTTGQQVQRVGVAKSADILFFDPSIDVGEI